MASSIGRRQIKISSQFSTIGKTDVHRVAKLCMLHLSIVCVRGAIVETEAFLSLHIQLYH